MNKYEIISAPKANFGHKGDSLNIDMAFLYGSWASGFPKEESDIDIAEVLEREMEVL